MRTDNYGQQIFDEMDLCIAYMKNPSLSLKKVLVEKKINFSDELEIENPNLIEYSQPTISVNEFDNINKSNWYMPVEYTNLDIAKFVLDQCQSQEELQRAGEELLLFQERDMFPLLRYLKYLVDTMRNNNITWGVGRGSSVASYVLFLIGIHRINSLHFDLPIEEFIK